MIWPVYNMKKEGYTKRAGDIVWINRGGSPTPSGRIDGANNATITQGTDFDLSAGVKAYDAQGNEIPFTVTPDTIDVCAVGEQIFTYTAGEVTKERKITITEIPAPTIYGLDDLTVEVNEEFDPLQGVTAKDGNDNPVEVTVEEPTPTRRIILRGEGYIGGVPNESQTTITDPTILVPNYEWQNGETSTAVFHDVVVNGVNRGDVECEVVFTASASINFVIANIDLSGNSDYVIIDSATPLTTITAAHYACDNHFEEQYMVSWSSYDIYEKGGN